MAGDGASKTKKVKKMAGDGASKTKTKSAKMTMEEYLDFIHSNKKIDLTVDHLHQIIDMHGFKKIIKQQKSVLIEAVNSLELLDPARSTVNVDGVSPDAILSIDDIIKDLNELKWQECCVTSLQTLNAMDDNPSPGSTTDAGSALTISSEVPAKPKRRLKRLRDIIQNSCALTSSGTETVSSSPSLVSKWMSRKKRSMKNNEAEIGCGGEGELDDGGIKAAAGENQPLEN